MIGNRERLIESELYIPLSNEEFARRNGILVQVAERIARGEKVYIGDIPDCCVFRADKPFNHVSLSGYKCCVDAELIADKLFGYEASRLCHYLSLYDTQQPPRPQKGDSPFEMYKWCTREEWDAWTAQRAQISIFDEY